MGNLSLLHSFLALPDVQHLQKSDASVFDHTFLQTPNIREFLFPPTMSLCKMVTTPAKSPTVRHLSRHPRCQQLHRRKPYTNDEHPSSSPSYNQGVMVYQLLPSDLFDHPNGGHLSPEKVNLNPPKTVTRNNLVRVYNLFGFHLFFWHSTNKHRENFASFSEESFTQ